MTTLELEKLRKSRSSAKGIITRVLRAMGEMKATTLSEYNNTPAERGMASLDRSYQSFMESHQAICDADSTVSEDQSVAEQDEQQMLYERALTAAQYIIACVTARDKGKEILLSIQGLQSNMSEGYDSSVADEFAQIAGDIRTQSTLMSVHGASDHPGLLEMRKHILEKWGSVRKTRSDSGYEAPRPAGPPGSASVMTVSSSEPKAHAVSVSLPSFSGKTTEFREFKTLFLSIITRQKHLSDDEKNALLLKSMSTLDSQEQVRMAIKRNPKFSDVIAMLSRRYENCREVIAYHLKEFLGMPVLGQNSTDIRKAIKFITDDVEGMVKVQCLTTKQCMVGFMDGRFSTALRLAWRTKSAACKGPPDSDLMLEFLEEQEAVVSHIAGSDNPRSTHQNQSRRRSNQRKKEAATPSPRVKEERSPSPSRSISPPRHQSVFQATKQKPCSYCQEAHNTFTCQKFKAMAPQERQTWAKEAKKCYNCLSDKHVALDCKSERRCQDCKASHHTLLHIPKWDKTKSSSSSSPVNLLARVATPDAKPPVTAIAQVSAGSHRCLARLMVDTGAEVTMISKELAISLHAPHLHSTPVRIGGMGSVVSPYAIELTLHGEEKLGFADETVIIDSRVLEHLRQPTSRTPNRNLRSQPFLKGRLIADPDYGPGSKVDIILDLHSWQNCRVEGTIKGPQRDAWADCSLFGWVTGGSRLDKPTEVSSDPQVLVAQNTDEALNHLITQQWNDPELPKDESSLSIEDMNAELTFESTCHKVNPHLYEVRMLILEHPPTLGESRRQAVSRYRSVEKSMRTKGMWEAYREAVLDFIKTGHAEPVPSTDLAKPNHVLLHAHARGV